MRSSWFAAFGVMLLLSLMWIWRNPTNTASLVLKRTPTLGFLDATHSVASVDEQIRDVDGDYALGVEDYPDAIRLHREVVRQSPRNALAHYHLGFALGMMGERETEVREYQRAAALGLRTWDFFLNVGLAQADNGDLRTATDSLRWAVLLGKDQSESHFNLALVYERRGMLAAAERETLASLRLNPKQPDARNLLGVIYAQEGKTLRASLIWRELTRNLPDYEPARTNLALLGDQNEVALGKTAAVALPQRPPSKPSKTSAKPTGRNPTYARVRELRYQVEMNNERTSTK